MPSQHPEDQRRYISELYELSGNSRTRAAKMFRDKFGLHIHPQSISHYWKADGFLANPVGGRRHGLADGQFIDLYNHFNGDANLIAEASGFKLESIITRCNKMNLSYVKKPGENKKRMNWDIDPDLIQSGGARKSRPR